MAELHGQVVGQLSVYRCTECGHGNFLHAIAYGYVQGPLDKDGELRDYSHGIEDFGIEEDTIECEKHPSAVIEKKIGHRFRRWQRCELCKGNGRVPDHYAWRVHDATRRCDDCGGAGGAWVSPALAQSA